MATSFFSHAPLRTATSRLDALTKTAVVSPNRKKWNFNPRAKVRANGEIPELRPVLSHRLGEKPAGLKIAIASLRQNIIAEKEQNKQFKRLREMTTATGKKCSLNENGKLKIGNRFANKAEQAQFASL